MPPLKYLLQPMTKEMCASCLQPVYSMERVVTDKVCVHHSCFCCQVCRKKLSLKNYAALHGLFYCQVHYNQTAGAKSRSETDRLEHQLGDHQVQRVAVAGRGPQPQDCSNRPNKKTETREKPMSFSARHSLQVAEPRQEANSRSILLGNKLKMDWPPSETASVPVDGKAGKGACSWKKPTVILQTYQAAGSRASRRMLRGQEGKSAAEAAMEKRSFLPGVTFTKERQQACSWPKTREQTESDKTGDEGEPKRKQGGKVSQRVAAIQQDKAQLKKGPASVSSPLVLAPVKPLSRSSLVHQATHQSTKPTNWMYPGGTEGCLLSAAEPPVKENEVCGSLSTVNKRGTVPARTDCKSELSRVMPATAGDKHHLGEIMNTPQPTCRPEEPQIRNPKSIEVKHGADGVDSPENEAEEAHYLSGVSRTPHSSSGSLEPRGLSVSPEIAELMKETSKTNNEFPGKQIPVSLEENTQQSSISHLPGFESKEAEFEKTKEMKPISTLGFLEEPSPEHTSQENTAEKSRVSSSGLPDKTNDQSASCLQEAEPQGTCGSLLTNPKEDILRHDIKSPGKDFPVSADTPLKGSSATWPSHDEISNSKSKDPREVLNGNIFPISEQPAKTVDSSKPNIPLDKSGNHPVSEEKLDLKLPGESIVHMSQSAAQSKETRSNQACREMLGKGFRLGKKPFTMLFGSEDKGNTPKETATQRKPSKPQSALATLFGYSSEKKTSQQEESSRSSEQTNSDNRPEKTQILLSSSNQAKQKSSKNDRLPQLEKMEVFPKHIQENSGGFSDSTKGKENNILFLAPSTSISCDNKHERTKLDIHDQLPLTSQVCQKGESCWSSLRPAQENLEEDVVTLEGGANPVHPHPEPADESKNLIGEENNDAHLLEMQNLLSLDVQDTVIEDGKFFSSSSSEKSPKDSELQLDVHFLEDSNLFFSGGLGFPSITSKTPNSDLQNSEAETLHLFDPNPSEFSQETPGETNASQVLQDTSSLPLLAGKDGINIRDLERIQSYTLLQQLDPQCQPPTAAEDTFGLGLSAEGSTTKHLSVQGGNHAPMYLFSSHASETFSQAVFDPFDVDSTKTGEEASEKMNRSRKTSGDEAYCESLSSTDLNVLNDDDDDPLDQEFFI